MPLQPLRSCCALRTPTALLPFSLRRRPAPLCLRPAGNISHTRRSSPPHPITTITTTITTNTTSTATREISRPHSDPPASPSPRWLTTRRGIGFRSPPSPLPSAVPARRSSSPARRTQRTTKHRRRVTRRRPRARSRSRPSPPAHRSRLHRCSAAIHPSCAVATTPTRRQ
jgi:hypothetical protein